MNNVAAYIIVFASVSIIGLAYFLIIPATFTRIQANVTNTQTNATLISAVDSQTPSPQRGAGFP